MLVAVGYYLGAQIGFALQSPDAPQSVLWLPNSILLAVLLSTPPRQWIAYLAAAFPAQMLVAWQSHAPLVTMALLFVTNCADAGFGAWLVRRVSRQPGVFRFDGLRSAVVFALLATLATVVMSFADAGISVATGWSTSYMAALVTRIRSNPLTHLIVVPPIVELLALDWRRVRAPRLLEATALMILIAGVGTAVFARSPQSTAFPAVLYLPLPLLLWAAVRFGPGAAGGGVFVIALVASWEAVHGHGPFAGRTSLDEVRALQLFLLASVVPLLFLAAVVRERDRASAAIQASELALRRSYDRVRELAGKLIAAQDLERSRIARDMHDDFNQQLAAVAIAISALRQAAGSRDSSLDAALRDLHERVVRLTDQVRQFSRDLHPGMLHHVGLVPALRTHCATFGAQHHVEIEFTAPAGLDPVDRDVAVCMYRIAQEALRNVVNHAGVGTARAVLRGSGTHVELTISDAGRGFDVNAPAASRGLGLLSIEERARLLGGTVTLTSAPGRGTSVHVMLPVGAGVHAA